MKQGRLTIGLIGQSVEAIAICQALELAGHQVVAISANGQLGENSIETLLPAAKRLPEDQVFEMADLVILGVRTEEIVSTIARLIDHVRKGQLIVHLAAEFDHEVLAEVTNKGAIALAMHPAMRFTGTGLDLNRIKESYFAVSAPTVALPIVQALVIEMGAEPIVVLGPERKLYAEAITVAGNFSAMIVNQAVGLLEQAGVENPALVIAPVIESAVDQALSKGHQEIKPEDLIGDS